ncbi:uncharacterized protein METZ01_LOCUS406844 [marine metagenome]|uniref:Uncharacterized protein n=1 Tax=marine metagenome TaxID=408172 RepID=A0A382W5W9_9ZZZZ
MGKKKKTKRNLRPVTFISGIVLTLAIVYSITKPPEYVEPVAPATGELVETRPVMSSAFYTGKAAEAYRIAAEIPKIIDSQFCYCYCKKNHQHKTLLTCFTSEHGSKCDTCMDEVLYAYQLYKRGKTLDEIVAAIDKKFYRPYKPQRL